MISTNSRLSLSLLTAACISHVTLPIEADQVVNATDPRNCENYYKCTGYSCFQCPCPDNEKFDPQLLKCVPIAQASACVCEIKTTTTTAKTTTDSKPANGATIQADIIVSPVNQAGNAEKEVSNKPTTTEKNSDEVNNGIIIIAAIVSATVIILVFLVIGFVLWQKGLFVLR